jgi:hypothetical protein
MGSCASGQTSCLLLLLLLPPLPAATVETAAAAGAAAAAAAAPAVHLCAPTGCVVTSPHRQKSMSPSNTGQSSLKLCSSICCA